MSKPNKALRKAATEYKMRQQYGDGLYGENYEQKFLLKRLANKIKQKQMSKKEKPLDFKRNSIYSDLKPHCHVADHTSYIEITEWSNGEGVDVTVFDRIGHRIIALTFGEVYLIKKLTKKLEENR